MDDDVFLASMGGGSTTGNTTENRPPRLPSSSALPAPRPVTTLPSSSLLVPLPPTLRESKFHLNLVITVYLQTEDSGEMTHAKDLSAKDQGLLKTVVVPYLQAVAEKGESSSLDLIGQ